MEMTLIHENSGRGFSGTQGPDELEMGLSHFLPVGKSAQPSGPSSQPELPDGWCHLEPLLGRDNISLPASPGAGVALFLQAVL